MPATLPMHHAGSVLRIIVAAHHHLPEQETDEVLFEGHRTVVVEAPLATRTAQGQNHLSLRLGPGGDSCLPRGPWLLERREFLSCRMPPALELAGDPAMLRGCLLVLCTGPRRFVLALLELQAQRVGGLTRRRLIGLRRVETGLSGQRAARLQPLFPALCSEAGPPKAPTVVAASPTSPPAPVACRRAAVAPRAPLAFAATTATAQPPPEPPMALAH